MKKDQMAAELEKLKAELEAAKKQIEATAGANSILEDELKKCRTEQKRESGDGEKIKILLGVIAKSCADHCPHHLEESACVNCSIFKDVTEAGFKIEKKGELKKWISKNIQTRN